MLVKVAWRNIWRHKTRSAVIIASVLIGAWAGLFLQAYVNGMVEQRVRTAIEKEISHIQVHQPEFKSDYEVKNVVADGLRLISEISVMRGVLSVSGRLVTRGMIATATGSAGIKINGVEPVAEDSTIHLSRNIIQGTYFKPGMKNAVLVGEKLLKKLNVKLNSKVVLTLVDKDNNISSGAFRVKGVYQTLNGPYDESNVFVTKADLAPLTATQDGVTEIAVLLGSNAAVDSVAGRIRSLSPESKTETWMETAPEMSLIVSSSEQSTYIYLGIIMLALAFGIINTMLMAVLERTREIGMLMALGMTRLKIFLMVLLETCFLVLTSMPVGILLAMATVAWLGHVGIDLSDAKAALQSFGMSEIIYPVLTPGNYITVLEMILVTAFVSALFPARKALSLNPSEAIRK